MAHLFVLDLTYPHGIQLVEEHLDAHRAFLAEHYADGRFLASGRKEPRTGGIILAHGNREQIEALVATDPFSVHGAADYTITEFLPTITAPELNRFAEPAPPA